MSLLTRVASLGLVLLTAACGGGGVGGTPFGGVDVAAALDNLLTTTASWSVSGRGSDGRDYTATVSVAPGARGTYPLSGSGREGTTSVQSVTLRLVGVGEFSGTTTVYRPDGLLLPEGFRDDDGSCRTVTSGDAPPRAAALGATGPLLVTNDFDSCGVLPLLIGTSTTAWSVEVDNGVTYFCLTTTERDVTAQPVATEADCVEVAADGKLGTRALIRINEPGGLSLVMRG